jgi:alkylhydroperoxidase/carboxymuconolactone decarboxylase family protein YurZ
MSPEELAHRLSAVQAKRGYLLPHHGLLAITSPAMMKAYDDLYTTLALDHKTLSVRDRELVWLAVLIGCDEALATHHIARFLDGGGSDAEFKAVLQLTASLKGVTAFRFVQDHWMAHLPSLDIVASYREAVERAGHPLSPRDIWLCACSVHAALGHFDWLHHALVAAYARGVAEPDLAEAMTLMMFPGSVPNFVEAARVWMEAIRGGHVSASQAFSTWANMPGQGGYDEASGKARG